MNKNAFVFSIIFLFVSSTFTSMVVGDNIDSNAFKLYKQLNNLENKEFSWNYQEGWPVEIAGGACAGTIWEKGTTWYKNLVGNKKVFIAFTSGATKITGLSWLPRSHDDNFSPSSFKGLANPDQFLLKNGYNYFEGLTNSNVNQLVQSIYNVATS